MPIVADEVDQKVSDSVGSETRVLSAARRLPAARIAFVPFSLVEVELLADDE